MNFRLPQEIVKNVFGIDHKLTKPDVYSAKMWIDFNVNTFYFVINFSGIDVVRNKIKMFAQQKVTLPKGRHKIIILDEADRLEISS